MRIGSALARGEPGPPDRRLDQRAGHRHAGRHGGFLKFLEADRLERFKTGKVNYLPVVAADNNAVLNTTDSYEWFSRPPRPWPRAGRTASPSSRSRSSWSTAPPSSCRASPRRPVVAENDTLTPTDVAIAA
jgi:hypothetical protein